MSNETDRELLELAAHAADIKLLAWNDGTEPYSSGVGFILRSNGMWNPLNDDGDALRLAAELKLDISYSTDGQRVYVSAGGEAPYCEAVGRGLDKFGITRRAIVRASAEIERQRSES